MTERSLSSLGYRLYENMVIHMSGIFRLTECSQSYSRDRLYKNSCPYE